jgi:hypothetical protein
MDPNVAKLLGYAAISAGVGLGGAGLYGLTKYIHDSSLLGAGQGRSGRIKKRENLLAVPQKTELKNLINSDNVEESNSTNPAEMITDDSSNDGKSDLSAAELEDMRNPDAADVYKQSGWFSDVLGEPFLAGAATPMAAIAPGVATYIIGKKLIDQKRKANLQKEINKAKNEFELALSKTSSELQQQIDALYKSADLKPTELMKDPPSSISVAARPEAAGMGIGPSGLAYAVGLAPGVGALLGWMIMNRQMKKDPDRQKLKELNNLLKRDVASGALTSGIDLEENKEGKPTFKL